MVQVRDRDGDLEAANRGSGRDANHMSDRVQERSTGEAVVHRRRRADDLLDGSAPARTQRAADDGDDACAGGHSIAPRASHGKDDLTDAGCRPGSRRGGEAKARRAQDGQAGRGIPPGELCVDVPTVVGLDLQMILTPERPRVRDDGIGVVYEAADRPSSAADLDDGWRDGRNRVGDGIRESRER